MSQLSLAKLGHFWLAPTNRDITTRQFSVEWCKEVGEVPGLERLFFDYVIGPGGSAAINVELTHPDAETLEAAATITDSRAYTETKRVAGKRVINVKASVIQGQANENKILASLKNDFMSQLKAKYAGLKYSFEGRQRDQRRTGQKLFIGLAYAYAMTSIFCFLAIPFKNYAQAILVMLSIPFGLVCALVGHIIMGYDLNIISIFGMITLCEIVVNGDLVFIITANKMMRKREKFHMMLLILRQNEDFALSCSPPLRPSSDLPMIFEQSVQSKLVFSFLWLFLLVMEYYFLQVLFYF